MLQVEGTGKGRLYKRLRGLPGVEHRAPTCPGRQALDRNGVAPEMNGDGSQFAAMEAPSYSEAEPGQVACMLLLDPKVPACVFQGLDTAAQLMMASAGLGRHTTPPGPSGRVLRPGEQSLQHCLDGE